MPQEKSRKSTTRSVKSTGKRSAPKTKKKQRKVKPGMFFTIGGDPEFFFVNVEADGTIERTLIKPEVVVDCVMYVLEESLKKTLEHTEEQATDETVHCTNGGNNSGCCGNCHDVVDSPVSGKKKSK